MTPDFFAAVAAEAAWSEVEKKYHPEPTAQPKSRASKRSSKRQEQSDDDSDRNGPVEPGAFYLCAETKQWKPFRTKLSCWKSIGVIRFNDDDNNWMWTTGRRIGWVPTIEEAKAMVER